MYSVRYAWLQNSKKVASKINIQQQARNKKGPDETEVPDMGIFNNNWEWNNKHNKKGRSAFCLFSKYKLAF